MQYGDAFYPHDLDVMAEHFLSQDKTAMFVCTRHARPEKNHIAVDGDVIVLYDKGNASGACTLHDAGIVFFRKRILEFCEADAFRLAEYIMPRLITGRQASAYASENQSWGIGSPEKIPRFEAFLETHPGLLEGALAFKR